MEIKGVDIGIALMVIHGIVEPFVHVNIWKAQMSVIKCEGWNQDNQIELDKYDDKWHNAFVVMWSAIYLVMCASVWSLVPIIGLVSRASMFPIVLNLLKGESPEHMSRDQFDAWITKMIAPKRWMIAKVIILLLFIVGAIYFRIRT